MNLLFIPEITTTIKVDVGSDSLDNAISLFESDPILATAGQDALDKLLNAKSELEGLADPVANALAETMQSYQEQIIAMNGSVRTGMMKNSVEVTHDGDGVYLVGNTASSPDGFPYPLAIETGRRAVYPVEAKVLHWVDGGRHVFAKRSRAVDAKPFVQPSIDNTMEDAERIIDDYMKTIFG